MQLTNSYGETYKVDVLHEHYTTNGNLALVVMYKSGDLAGEDDVITVNFEEKLPDDQAYLDTNNCPWALSFIRENRLGKFAGYVGLSGYCEYPLYEFNLDALSE